MVVAKQQQQVITDRQQVWFEPQPEVIGIQQQLVFVIILRQELIDIITIEVPIGIIIIEVPIGTIIVTLADLS